MAKKKQTKKTALKKPYQPTQAEKIVVDEQKSRKETTAPPFQIKVENRDRDDWSVAPDHPDPKTALALCLKTFGTDSPDFSDLVFSQLIGVGQTNDKPLNTTLTNGALAAVAGIGPQDETEAMLAVQMVAIHDTAMKCLKRANLESQTFEGRQLNLNYAVKMSRTYTAQMEALKKYRTKGQQINVEHVHVHQGGQAIVGNVTKGGGRVNEEK